MNILGLIPARGGSKGVPGKNIKLLGDKPLLQYTTDIAKASKRLSKVVVSSDDDHIIGVAKALGVEAPFKRPAHLAEDTTPTLQVILHTLDFYASRNEFFDAVCLLQVTAPFRTVAFMDRAIEQFIEKRTDSLISVLEVPHEFNPHWLFEADENQILHIATGEKEIITRRQELPKAFYRDGSIYITKTEVLQHQASLYGESTAYIQASKEFYVNIDTQADWERAEQMAEIFNNS
ncbi:cytidylyltransferase domain-containing protein [Gelidibacter mesophilus]|uniref:acylneuraminate cytidylyltransferase family protein n=1 Tax=Gelidibacter mesophilus TaxID=169050 RepID=UPI0003FA4025|nr:acylneuraminate cytidylyltransferase family protein [Gelidibacter mesophilus]